MAQHILLALLSSAVLAFVAGYDMYDSLMMDRRGDMSYFDDPQVEYELLNRDLQQRADKENLEPSSLYGHKYVQGGTGEGSQSVPLNAEPKLREEVKTDAVLPSYCEPPNPCPRGFSSEDGCLEDFVNTAEFSQAYQARQNCMCDEEHMFKCQGSQKRVADVIAVDQDAVNTMEKLVEAAKIEALHKGMVAKKFSAKKRGGKKNNAFKSWVHRLMGLPFLAPAIIPATWFHVMLPQVPRTNIQQLDTAIDHLVAYYEYQWLGMPDPHNPNGRVIDMGYCIFE